MAKAPILSLSRKGMTVRPDLSESGAFQIQVDAWELEAPSIEYFADDCSAKIVRGSPTIFFAQRGPDDTIINAIAVAMPPKRFKDMVDAFRPVIDRISPEERAAGHQIEASEISVTPASFRKFWASIVRGGIAMEGAMMDFFRVAMTAEQQLKGGQIPDDIVSPCVRVFMTPPMMVHLFDTIIQQELAS